MTQIIDFWEKKVRESPTTEGTGRAVRGAHAKTIGVVRAEVEILGDVPAPYAQGIYAKPGRHDALIRFSSASNHLGPDAQLGPVLGFAIKIFDVDGTKLVEDEPDATTFDLVLKNNPTFIANTAKHYLFIQEIGNNVRRVPGARQGGLPRAADRFPHRQGHVRAVRLGMGGAVRVRESGADAGAQSAAEHVLDDGGGASRRLRRQGPRRSGRGERRAGDPPRTRPHAADRTCSVRPWWTNCKHTPSISTFRSSCARTSTRCRSTTRRWNGRRSCPPSSRSDGYISRARTSRDRRTLEKGDALAFNQWRVTADHRPLGEIMEVRRIYTASAKVRRTLNHQPQTEPTSADEVLPLPKLPRKGPAMILAGKADTPEGQDAITTDKLANIVVQGLAEERFMISTHGLLVKKFAVKAAAAEYAATTGGARGRSRFATSISAPWPLSHGSGR